MKRDQLLGALLIVISLGISLILTQVLFYKEAGFRPEMFILPAIGFLIGVLMIVTDFESRINLQEIIDDLPISLADDLDDIVNRRITMPLISVVITIAALMLQIWLVIHFRKWNADWFGVSVLLIAALVVIGTIIFIYNTSWFQDRYRRTSATIYIIPAIGFAACAALGYYYAEPQSYGELSLLEQDQLVRSERYYSDTRGSQIFSFIGRSSGSSRVSLPDIDCDGDACGAIIIFFIVVIVVISSAFIPHFWVVATSLLLTIMLMYSVRELIFYEKRRGYPRW
jgi:hypothetical protein